MHFIYLLTRQGNSSAKNKHKKNIALIDSRKST